MNAVAKIDVPLSKTYNIPAKKRIIEYLKPGHELYVKDIAEALAAEDYNTDTIVSATHWLLKKGILERTLTTKPSPIRLVKGQDYAPGKGGGKRKSPVKQGQANIKVPKISNTTKPVETISDKTENITTHTNRYDQVVRNKVPDVINGIIDNYKTREISEIVVGLRAEVARIFGFEID